MLRHPVVKMSTDPVTDARRTRVLKWILNGYVLDGKRVSIDDLAVAEQVSISEIRRDMQAVQSRAVRKIRSSAGLRHRLLEIFNNSVEMALADRGRAIEQFEHVRRFTFDQNTGEQRPPDRDTSYQLYLFGKLAQESTANLIKLLGMTMGKADVINQVVLNLNGGAQVVTTARAVELLRTANAVVTLPSDRYRAAMDGDEVIDAG